MPILEVNGLTKHFDVSGGVMSRLLAGSEMLKAVDQISFSVPEGKTFGLVGESGCGKSTTARLITRLIPATCDDVYFEVSEILILSNMLSREPSRQIHR